MQFEQGKKYKIVVGMSGGVDSSVAALLLKKQGHEVIGLFMKNWEEDDVQGVCSSEQDYADVKAVCQKLDIPYFSVNFSKEYQDNVFSDFLSKLKQGLTPNPDILCNREIKFKALLNYVLDLGADFLATGHYCQRSFGPGEVLLLRGRDATKDQSYFLHAIGPEVLGRVLFPIGHLEKKEVRKLAQEVGLPTSFKKDSTGICFIGERKFREFLNPYLGKGCGDFKTLSGQIVGKHLGVAYYTLGQRKGLGLGGAGEPWFVVAKDVEKNVVYVERGEHPALYAQGLYAGNATWIAKAPWDGPGKITAKIRYRQDDQDCEIVGYNLSGEIEVKFSKAQRAITPAQSIVFYRQEECLGGALILRPYDSYFSLGLSLDSETTKSGPMGEFSLGTSL